MTDDITDKVEWKITYCINNHIHVEFRTFSGSVRGELIFTEEEALEFSADLLKEIKQFSN